ncbi:hypothetical protein M011DRAFT_401703 [Sporormia fimetaria CBS 119925]|uniref:SNF2 family helicase/ATPase-like protein n=1 Tax=Sporormia fimetaria CBS 119925 TaxID=1340428 RepID=A0A6A6VB14_9PLEO|nr:hypothetical protein M011DRAFT_401703 [Sporormia fimetaria CBS 119925]
MTEGPAEPVRALSAHPPPAFDPAALLNPKASKRSASEAGSDRGRSGPPAPNYGSLVERLHHVQERTASPAKRVRYEGDDSRKMQAGFSGGSTLTMNGSPITNVPPSAIPEGPPVDLTMSDDEDEDIQVLKDNSREEICIGKVKQAYVQLHRVPFHDPQKYRGNAGSQGRIKVSLRRMPDDKANNNYKILVVDPANKECGRVDYKTAQPLARLFDARDQNGMKFTASLDPRRKLNGEGNSGDPSSALISMTLQLYCKRGIADHIGRFLRSHNVMLGDPTHDIEKYDYYNPQTKSTSIHQGFGSSLFSGPQIGQSHAAPVVLSVEEIRSEVSNIFDHMGDQADIPEHEQSPAIITELLKHQKQALHFMLDKEQEWSDDKKTLWKPAYRDNGRKKMYVHVITGEPVKHQPESVRGGILADEMGLGKTLSILALIMDRDSLTAAKNFAMKVPPLAANGERRHFHNSRATLLVCPLSTMVNWKTQIRDHFGSGPDNGPKWCYYHGPDRRTYKPKELADYDLVITTYHIVAADARDPSKPLSKIQWFRIVLDEAHQIRSHRTKQALGVCELAAQRRWAVTGTPVQNKLEDLFSLFKFLRVRPFDNLGAFNRHILTPFKQADPDVIPKLQVLVSSLTLRRVKEGNVVLPPRSDQIVRLKFTEDERRLHEWFESDTARKVNAVTSGEKLGGKVYARIMTLILYLRRLCAHGRDLLGDEALKLTEGMTSENPMELDEEEEELPALSKKAAYEMMDILYQNDVDRCQYPACHRRVSDAEDSSDEDETSGDEDQKDLIGWMTPCYHIICPSHEKKFKAEWESMKSEDDGLVVCQFCDSRIRPVLFELTHSDWDAHHEELERQRRDPKMAKRLSVYTGPHTKTKALLEELRKSKEETEANPEEPPIKSVVFSTWTDHLDLIQIALENHSHIFTRLDGKMDRKSRDQALTAFANDPTIEVILVSIGAGGLGLNLTTANKVYVMEPQYNPAAEAQAVDRVHRLGQTRPVTIQRFIMEDSFEEKMLELQRKKKALADLTMSRGKESKEKLAELRSLFR